MSIFGPIKGERTKFCFVYCGPERCDCGATYIGPEELDIPKPPVEQTNDRVEEKKKDENSNA